MTSLEVTRILCAVLTLFPLSWGIPIDAGLCDDWNLPCQCGSPGFTFHIKIKQCTRFYRWKAKCKPCQDINEHALCAQYRYCLDCNVDVDGCVKCPARRYGRWCQQECDCQNGGSCDESGRCTCTVGFQGNKCEKAIECPRPQLSENVIVQPNAPTYSFDSKVNFRCEEGFLLEGTTEVTCLENQRWSKIAPICLPLCPDLPLPTHGSANLPLGQIVPGTMVRFVCNEGFALSGPSSRRCQEDGVWSRTQPTCVPSIECPQPSIPANSIVLDSSSKSPFSPGSTLSIECKEGFILVGKGTMKCEETGKWSQQVPRCVRADETCVDPGPVVNGKTKVESGAGGEHVYVMGTHLQFSCDPLHFLVGSSQATCQGNGTWSASLPTCVKVTTCSALDSLPNGYIHFLKPEVAMHSARSSSGTQYNMTRRSGKRGRFRANFQPRTGVHEAALRMALPEGFYHVGTQASFECESRYYKLEGSSTRTCLASGDWSGRPSTCIPLCGRSSDPRTPFITHGTPSDVGQWPWMVGVSRLTIDGDYILHCGASLIDERWVITAAHCVTYEYQVTLLPINELQFYAGKYYWNSSLDDNQVQARKADSIIVHPDYDPFSFDSDIALIHLAQPVHLTSRVQPVCLPSEDPIESQERLKDGKRGVVIGWGETEDAETSDVLMHVQAPVVPTNTCIQGYKESGLNIRISSSMFCAGYEAGKHDACSGDSGGPFVFPADATATKYILEGITSWGSPGGCGLEKQYGGYVRVQRFVEWIHNFI